jgi:hypothetical protein
MSNLLYSLFFGAGVSAIAYTYLGRRVGYSNTQNIWVMVAIIFVLTSAFFYTIAAYVLNLHPQG